MAATVNERLADEAVHHAIDIQGFSNGVVRRLLALLNRVDARLFDQLQTALGSMDPESFTVQRLDLLLQSVRTLHGELYRQFEAELLGDLRGLAETEAAYNVHLFRSLLPAQVDVAAISQDQVYAAALSRPMQGRLLREWASSIEASRMTRIRDTLRMGFVEGKTTAQIVREIRGTRAKAYQDGIIEIDRRNAEAVVDTAIKHTAAVARDQFVQANLDLMQAEVWRATLDSKTSQPCRLRDGKEYTPGTHKPIGHTLPWGAGPGRFHWRCRSCASMVVKGADALGLGPAYRASMDGQVPAETTYSEWLGRQSAARQDEILGPTRGALLRRGRLTLEKFANDKGQWLTLDQLKERNGAAFKRVGL